MTEAARQYEHLRAERIRLRVAKGRLTHQEEADYGAMMDTCWQQMTSEEQSAVESAQPFEALLEQWRKRSPESKAGVLSSLTRMAEQWERSPDSSEDAETLHVLTAAMNAVPQTFGERYGTLLGSAEGLPADLAAQHPHYRLGTPKTDGDTCQCGPHASVCHSGMCSKCGREATNPFTPGLVRALNLK